MSLGWFPPRHKFMYHSLHTHTHTVFKESSLLGFTKCCYCLCLSRQKREHETQSVYRTGKSARGPISRNTLICVHWSELVCRFHFTSDNKGTVLHTVCGMLRFKMFKQYQMLCFTVFFLLQFEFYERRF